MIEQVLVGEFKSLDSGGKEVWHPKDFPEALRVIEQAGPEHKERVDRIRKSMEPYRGPGRIFDLYDF
jgi:hypothetical protein